MNLVVASDKGGFALKEHIKAHLTAKGHSVIDVGTTNPETPILFYDAASAAARAIQDGRAEKGFLCCNTGMGMSQIANKHKGIFAACCESVYSAIKCREVNDSNVLCMGGWVVAPQMGLDMTDAFLATGFAAGLPAERVEYLKGLREKARGIDAATRK